ncbi:cupin domain-containing protein [Rhizobium sp. RMa-01]|uniref:cupin domain-containing protein n=1 Tax=unclassified Rhizobium TaxID=2613769 RepID=UPI0008D9A779|nr:MULTISPECIES: cupin domain-containing protein [unclassified Rhizobium]OHV20696.1 cupin [Rhizobium sp. RSm-3]RVU12801.1 cupin domain-containing protein [Rhizobium sp. RMa-01]
MARESKAVINIADLKLDHWQQGALYESLDTSFGTLLGLTGLGVSYNEVPPGKSGCPFHNHHVEDELFYVISGTGEYRFGDERHPIGAGDVLGAPSGGPETAHQIINTGTAPLVYLGISTMAKTEIVEYPDSGKFLAKTNRGDSKPQRFRHIGRPESDLDYWDGEPGA